MVYIVDIAPFVSPEKGKFSNRVVVTEKIKIITVWTVADG